MKSSRIMVALLFSFLSAPHTAYSATRPALPSLERQADVVTVATKKKKKKQTQFRQTPGKGDVLIGRVPGFRQHDFSNARRAREGDDLGGVIGQAVNNFMRGGIPSASSSGSVPMGGAGRSCGPQYWTSTPTSPAC